MGSPILKLVFRCLVSHKKKIKGKGNEKESKRTMRGLYKRDIEKEGK